jgi:hypothetical protein
MLSSHPDIFIPDETGFIPFLLEPEHLKNHLNQAEVQRILHKIGRLNYLWCDLVTDVPSFYRELTEPTLENILDSLFCRVTSDFDAIRWGDKTPLYVRYIPVIAEIFPEAQFIHVIRDGRDATLSAQQKWGLAQFWYMDNYYLLQNWKTNVAAGRRDGSLLQNSQYLEIHYEQLVKHPEKILRKVCNFLDEIYYPEMLDFDHLAIRVGAGPDDHTEVMQPISESSIGRWRTQMSSFEKRMADLVAGSLLDELGYEKSFVGDFSNIEKTKLSLLAIKYFFVETFRQLLYRTGFLTLNRNMRRQKSD